MLHVLVAIALAGCGRIGFDERGGSFALEESPSPPCNAGAAFELDGIAAGLDRAPNTPGIRIPPPDGADEQSCVWVEIATRPSIEVWMRATVDACGVSPCTEPCGEPFAEVFAGPSTDLAAMRRIAQVTNLSLQMFEPFAFPLAPTDAFVMVCRQSTGSDRYDVEVDAILPGP